MKNLLVVSVIAMSVAASCAPSTKQNEEAPAQQEETPKKEKVLMPKSVTVQGVAQNPEGIEFNKNDGSFLLSNLNAGPIIKVNTDGSHSAFTSGEPYPMSTAGLQIDYKNNRLLVAGFNGMELYDADPATKGISNLRIYNLETGVLENDINLSGLVPDANAYFANDVAVDDAGNVYVSDWFAGVVYKVDANGTPSVLWTNNTDIPSGANGLDFHPDGYLLVSLVSVNEKGLYADYGLIKIPVDQPELAQQVTMTNDGFTGFDGMLLNENGTVVGVTNNGTSPGGNTLIELSSNDNWETATVTQQKSMKASTTVAVTSEGWNYVINQDFTRNEATDWTIEQIKF